MCIGIQHAPHCIVWWLQTGPLAYWCAGQRILSARVCQCVFVKSHRLGVYPWNFTDTALAHTRTRKHIYTLTCWCAQSHTHIHIHTCTCTHTDREGETHAHQIRLRVCGQPDSWWTMGPGTDTVLTWSYTKLHTHTYTQAAMINIWFLCSVWHVLWLTRIIQCHWPIPKAEMADWNSTKSTDPSLSSSRLLYNSLMSSREMFTLKSSTTTWFIYVAFITS